MIINSHFAFRISFGIFPEKVPQDKLDMFGAGAIFQSSSPERQKTYTEGECTMVRSVFYMSRENVNIVLEILHQVGVFFNPITGFTVVQFVNCFVSYSVLCFCQSDIIFLQLVLLLFLLFYYRNSIIIINHLHLVLVIVFILFSSSSLL